MADFNPNRFFTGREIINEVLIDTGDEYGVMERRCRHWLFRVWKEVSQRVIRTTRRMIIPISCSTNIAELPEDVDDIIFIGVIDECGKKHPVHVNPNIAPTKGIEDKRVICSTCHTEDLCTALEVEVISQEVILAGIAYTRTITRILQKDGSYLEEIEEPIPKYDNDAIVEINMVKTQEVLCNLEVLSCGCIPPSKSNIAQLCDCGSAAIFECSCCEPESYQFNSNVYGSVNLFKDEGYIQVSPDSCLNALYIEFTSLGLFKNGNFYFPEIAFEALIAGTYWRSIEKRSTVPRTEKDRAQGEFSRQMKLAKRRISRISIDDIIDAFNKIPQLPTASFVGSSGGAPMKKKSW